MTIPVSSMAKWKERYTEAINRSCYEYEQRNKEAEVRTRQMTAEEMQELFENKNYDYIKEIKV